MGRLSYPLQQRVLTPRDADDLWVGIECDLQPIKITGEHRMQRRLYPRVPDIGHSSMVGSTYIGSNRPYPPTVPANRADRPIPLSPD